MVIEISESVIVDKVDFSSNQWQALTNIIISGFEGKHVILIKKKVAEALIRVRKLGDQLHAKLLRLSGKYTQYYSILQEVDIYCKVELNCQVTLNEKKLTVPLVYFEDSSRTQRSTLLCENLSDCNLITIFGKLYNSRNYKKRSVAFSNSHGGGSTSEVIVKSYLEQQNPFLLTIMDSDMRYCGAPIGNTASGVKAVFDDKRPFDAYLKILDCHELENLIPDIVIEEAFKNDIEHKYTISNLKLINQLGFNTIRSFIDLKEGLNYCQLLTYCEHESSVYKVFKESILNGDLCSVDVPCCCIEGCSKVTCFAITRKISADLLLKAIDFLQNQDAAKYFKNMNTLMKTQIDELAKLAFSWGCGTPKMSA